MISYHNVRQIEEACQTDMRFIWFLGMEAAPDHRTIARFRNERLYPVIEDSFCLLIHKLVEMGSVSCTNVFVNGTKIEANADKYSFVRVKAVEKNQQKPKAKIEQETQQIAWMYCLRAALRFEGFRQR